jgi:predicted dehydrogenase
MTRLPRRGSLGQWASFLSGCITCWPSHEEINMSETNRRIFIQTASAGAAALAWSGPASGRAANENVTLGVIGPGGMGSHHVRALAGRPDVRIAYVCDVDQVRMNAAAKAVEDAKKSPPKAVKDLRQILDDKSVDAVVIATPDHWHAPAAILACEAAKHVYVEKPISHNIREGRLLVEAMRRSKKVVQVGTQSRSSYHIMEAMKRLRDGAIGEILVAKAWNSQLRGNIGKVKPSTPPATLDYDLWVGPATFRPYQSNMLPGSWRWFQAYGCGDAGNDGVHDIDIARWGLGVTTQPSTVTALGGKYFFDDDQEFPDTQYVVFEWETDKPGKRKQLIYEHRIWSPYWQEGFENGNAFYGTKGQMVLGKGGGWKILQARDKLVEQMKGTFDLNAHHSNFFEAVRGDKASNADAEVGHLSATLCHLANIGTRLGRTLRFDPKTETFPDDKEANGLVRRQYREGHWAVPKGA